MIRGQGQDVRSRTQGQGHSALRHVKKPLQLYIPKTGSIKLALGDFWLSLRGQLIAVTYCMSDVKVKVKVNAIS